MPINPILVVHGGAWAIPDDMVEAHLNGVRNAAAAGWNALERGGSALDAVEAAAVAGTPGARSLAIATGPASDRASSAGIPGTSGNASASAAADAGTPADGCRAWPERARTIAHRKVSR